MIATCRHSLTLIAGQVLLAAGGCHQDMYDQPRVDTLEASAFFEDGRASRPLVAGAVPYQSPWPGEAQFTGRSEDGLVMEIPIPVDAAILSRGQQRFNIYCSNCHGRTGDGDGMIVERGYTKPPTFHSDRLRGVAVGHLFDVITNGYGVMPSYAPQIEPDDRWAIAAYIRTLQWSRYGSVEDLTSAQRRQLEGVAPP